MRFRWLTLAAVFGVGLYGSAIQAATNTDYLALREKTPITALPDATNITTHFPTRTGRVIELTGEVTGLFTGDDNYGFLLRVDPKQTLILFSKEEDEDIAVGSTLRVLARIPAQGTVLECLSATADGPELVRTDLANLRADTAVTSVPETGIDLIAENNVPVVRYYRAPAFTPQPENRAPAAVQQPVSPSAIVQIYTQRIQTINDNIDAATAQKIAAALLKESGEHGVDPRLIFALVTQESRFNPKAVSHAGAMGLGQLMPGTAAGLGVRDPFDIEQNLCGTVRYIAGQLNQYDGRLSLALAAYNAGPGAVKRYGGIPPYRETQNYVSRIWKSYARLAGIDPDTGRQVSSK